MRKDLVRFLREISEPIMWIGVAMLIVMAFVAYFSNVTVIEYMIDNVLPVALSVTLAGFACELLRIKLDDNSNAKSEELL